MEFEWIVIFKELTILIKDLGVLTNRSRATKNLLLSELKNNLKQFENAKKINLTYEELIKILSNEQIIEARKKGFAFSIMKVGKVQDKHIKDIRNIRYKGKDCEWLFVNLCDKINELKQLQTQRNLSNLKELNIGRQLSNLLYKMKLLTQFISH